MIFVICMQFARVYFHRKSFKEYSFICLYFKLLCVGTCKYIFIRFFACITVQLPKDIDRWLRLFKLVLSQHICVLLLAIRSFCALIEIFFISQARTCQKYFRRISIQCCCCKLDEFQLQFARYTLVLTLFHING